MIKIYVQLMVIFTLSLFATEKGFMSLFLFKGDLPLPKSEILIDNKIKKFTDEDGYLKIDLDIGKHQLQIFAKEGKENLAFAKKPFLVEKGKTTQLILTLDEILKIESEDNQAPDLNKTIETKDNFIEEEKAFGELKLKIISSDSGENIKDARVFVKGSSLDAVSNISGEVDLKLPEGNYTISVIHSNFSSQTVRDLVISSKTPLQKSIKLTPASMELQEFVVLAPHIEGSMASLTAEQKKSDVIADIVGSEQMSKKGDSNAASALKRVAGLTVIGGKSVYVRGLGDRYASTELNSLALPSPNPLKRVVPLDLFPSGVIGTLQVQKTFSPDISGAFGGGYINIRTRNSVDSDYVKFSTGLQIHSSTGKSSYNYQGSSTDWLGFDNSYRVLDTALLNFAKISVGEKGNSVGLLKDDEVLSLKKNLNSRNFNVQKESVPLGYDASIEFSQNYKYEKHKFGILANYKYSTSSKSIDFERFDYEVSSNGVQDVEPNSVSTLNLSKTTIQQGGIFNLNYEYENFLAKLTKLYVLNSSDQTRYNYGTFGENSVPRKDYYLDWEEREIDVNQFIGDLKYHFYYDMELDFGAEYATSSLDQPANVQYGYTQDRRSGVYIFNSQYKSLDIENQFSEDTLYNFYVKNKIFYPLFSENDYLEIGVNIEDKEREARSIKYRVQESSSDNDLMASDMNTILDNYDEYKIIMNSTASDQYDADLKRNAIYFKFLTKLYDQFELSAGLRRVDLKQSVAKFNDRTDSGLVEKDISNLDFVKNLPSLSLKYQIDEKNQIRFAYSKSFVYPDFREFVQSVFSHPEQVALIQGNPNLIETDIASYDFRYEYYFNTLDNITTALFFKDLDNPIEDTQEFSTSGLTKYSFDNSKRATLTGIEISWLKDLEFISEYLEFFSISGNYTYISSDVTLTEDQKRRFVSGDRELQGLSPQILNLTLGYDNRNGRSLNLSYNQMDKRLMKVALKNGDVIFGYDDYEYPAPILDLVWIERFKSSYFENGLNFKLKLGNLLDGETEWKQKDRTTYKYKSGRDFSLSIGMQF
jgi:outer membrane receptor protein involved in Fe transport